MKNLLTILLLFFAVVVKAQYVPNAGAYQYKGLKQTNSLQPPSIAGYPVTSINAPDSNYAALYYNKTDTTWYQFNPISKTWSPFRTAGGVQIDSVFITSIDSIFITNTDSIFIISGNDTIYIGNSDQIRDTAKLTAGYGLIIVSPSTNDSVGFYGPNYDDRTVILDTSVLDDFISYVINNDTTIINNNDSVPAIIVDTLSNSPPAGATSGYKVLIGTSPTGLFSGHDNDIAELVGAVWTFTDPVCNQQVIVDNAITYATYQYNCAVNIWKQTSVLWRVGGNRGIGSNAFIGRPDKQKFVIRAWNKVGLIVDTTRDVLLPKYTGLESEPLFFKPGANGKIDTGRFKIPTYETPVNMDSVLYVDNGEFKYGTATGGGGGDQNLQQVTDIGYITTNPLVSTSNLIGLLSSDDVAAISVQSASDPSTTASLRLNEGNVELVINQSGNEATVRASNLTDSRAHQLPDSDGTLAVSATVNGGSKIFATSDGNIPLTVSGGTSFTRQVITSGSSGTVTGGNYLVTFDPASTLAAYTLTMPASPSDLDIVKVEFGGTLTSGLVVTALVVSGNSGQTIIDNTPPASATADNYLEYQYRSSVSKWYRRKE